MNCADGVVDLSRHFGIPDRFIATTFTHDVTQPDSILKQMMNCGSRTNLGFPWDVVDSCTVCYSLLQAVTVSTTDTICGRL